MADNMKMNMGFMGNGDHPKPPQPSNARLIVSFADFKKKISAIPMEEQVRKMLLERVGKYPEASLDYVWKRLQDFISAASRELASLSRKNNESLVQKPVEVVVEVPKPVAKPKPVITRPSFEEFDLSNGDL